MPICPLANALDAPQNLLGDYTSTGMVGPPQVPAEIKLIDVPDMGYRSTDKPDARGEMCVRGDCLFCELFRTSRYLSHFRR
jgi:long-chain acyl-CoA synthetase